MYLLIYIHYYGITRNEQYVKFLKYLLDSYENKCLSLTVMRAVS
jgi:hypothetical protein